MTRTARLRRRAGLLGLLPALVLAAASAGGAASAANPAGAVGVATGQHPALASAAYVKEMTTIPASVYDAVGTDDQPVPFTVTKGQPHLRSGNKPVLLYEGAEYCPYCALLRYAIVAALSRFGTFSHLHQTSSSKSDGDVPTFTFYESAYASRYVAFKAYERLDRQAPSPKPLQAVPSWARRLYRTYDGSETTGAAATRFNTSGAAGIPFLDLANAYVSTGDPAAFSSLRVPGGPLHDGGPGRLAIADGIRNPGSSTGTYVHGRLFLAEANYLTAAICSLDGDKPGPVCASSGVRAAANAMGRVTPVR